MKKNLLGKIIATTTTVIAATAMTVPGAMVSAVDTPTINAAPATVLQTATSSYGVPLNKDIVLFNSEASNILSPNIQYLYEITSPTVTNATITTYSPDDLTNGVPDAGASEIVIAVKPGVLGAVTTSAGDDASTTNRVEGTITFGAVGDTNGNDNTTTHPSNQEIATVVDLTKKVRGSMTITVNANKIYDPEYGTANHTNVQVNGPGVYRYKIEDVTSDVALTAAGITEGTSNDIIYLDVYTKYNTNKDGLEVYGYVFLKQTIDEGQVVINYDNNADETLKITGFDTDSENENVNNNQVLLANLKSDTYHTYNVEVSKVTTGSLADTQHNFPFKVELANANVPLDDFWYQITKDGRDLSAVNVNLSNAGTWSLDGTAANNDLQLQNGDKILITGLPAGTTIKVTETNDTTDTYTVSATYNNNVQNLKLNDTGTAAASVKVASTEYAEMNAAVAVNSTATKDTIVITNNLKDISVTGLLFSVAPFVFITAAGVVLLVLFMRNKKDSDNKSKI